MNQAKRSGAAPRVACVGGGPAGLYFSILTKKARPESEVVLFERNRVDDTFGFGVVFSDATLERLAAADRITHDAITSRFFHWDDIDVFVERNGVSELAARSRGHGFSGISRRTLLEILTDRARDLGVDLRHETQISPADAERAGDLVVVADGANSPFRDAHASDFGPRIDFRPNRFVWLGTTFPFDAFTFYFKNAPAGLFQVHAYRYEEGLSTFIVECSEETFRRSELSEDDEAGTKTYLERLFADELRGHPLLVNRSIWRRFPVIRNQRWHKGTSVLLGDAAHTAHFSIGSGTKLALEDAIALRESLDRSASVEEGLSAYERERKPVVESLQRAAQVSLEWFETTERAMRHDPLTFAFSLLTRSLRVTHENLMKRDGELVASLDRAFEEKSAEQTGRPIAPRPDRKAAARPPMFTPFKLRDLVLENRIGVSSMCMYSAVDGTVDDFHLVHLGSRAMGGAGLVMTEMTDVSADGRISPGCAGLYADAHVAAWRRVVDFVHTRSPSKIGVQLAHAGRKGATCEPWMGPDMPLPHGVPGREPWPLVAPSPLAYSADCQTPREMSRADMDRVTSDFVRATERADEAGFDLVELHVAHGYLLSTFVSPLTNHRTDGYGGTIERRLAYPLEVFAAMRAVWPSHKPMSVRISASDWAEGGTSLSDLGGIGKAFRAAGVDIIDVSAGGNVAWQRPEYGRLYQVPFSDLVRNECDIPTMTVGNISTYSDVNGILAARRADLCMLARAELYDPYWPRHAATQQQCDIGWPLPYGVLAHYNPRPQ